MTEQDARLEIERAFPELGVREIRFLGAGMDSRAYLVNGKWVFRFPQRPEVATALRREIALLPRLAAHLPVAVPRFTHLGEQAANGLLFAGYRLIPGEPLTLELFASLAPPDQERVLATLAAVLRAVHGFPLADAIACGVETFSTRDWVRDSWSAVRGAAQLLGRRHGPALARWLTGFLADARNFDGAPCLLYADFAPEHVLYSRAARAITGLIDWGDLAIGDPDFDLMYLYQDYGEEFVRRLLVYHPHPDPARLAAKLRVFNACDHLRDIATAHANPGEPAVQEAVGALRDLLARG